MGWGSLRAKTNHFLRGACAVLSATALILAAGCGGGHGGASASASVSGDSASGNSGSSEIAGTATQTYAVEVVVPDGVNFTPDQLTLTTSVASVKPTAAGSATIGAYTSGSQLAIVLTPSGNPLLMAWVDAQHTEISAATTAQVLGYFALGGPLTFSDTERGTMIAGMPTAQGIGAVEAAITSALKANPEAFASGSPGVNQSVVAFAAPFYAAAKASAGAAGRTAKAQAVSIDPAQQRSGIYVLEDAPFAMHLTNSYRRRAYAFVDRVSHTNVDSSGNSTEIDDSNSVTRRVAQFEIAPTIGLSGGLAGTIGDIMMTLAGAQPTAYADVSSPVDKNGDLAPVPLPLVDGSTKTTFQLTVVGPGGQPTSVAMTDEQRQAQIKVSISGNVQDYLMPFVSNVILGSGVVKLDIPTNAVHQFLADMGQSMSADLINYATASPDLQTAFMAGDTKTVLYILGTSNELQTILVKGFEVAASKCTTCAGPNTPKAAAFLKSFFAIVNLTGGILELGDAAARDYQISALSSPADQWTLVSKASKVALNPTTANVNASVPTTILTASVLGAENTAGFSYHWTTTTSFGDLSEIGGSSRAHQTDYCSSGNEAVFVYQPAGYHEDGSTDSVDVEVFSGPDCDETKGYILGEATTVLTYQQQIFYLYDVLITPGAQTFTGGGTVTFNALTSSPNGGPALPAGFTYRWHIISNVNSQNDSTDTNQGAEDTIAANTSGPTWTKTFPNLNVAVVKYNVWAEVIDADGFSRSVFTQKPISYSKITLISSTCPLGEGVTETICF